MGDPNEAMLQRIADEADPVVRNRLITRCYQSLAEQISDIVWRRDLNWFWFGAWASGTAGAVIRGEGLPIDLGTSRNIAAGNLAIILNVAPRFIRWLAEVKAEGVANPAALERTLAHPLFDDSPLLAEAIQCYQAAAGQAQLNRDLAVPDPGVDKEIAELMLLGTALTGAHEQALVDQFIDAAMPLGGLFGLVTTRFVHIVTPEGPLDVCRDVVAPRYLGGRLFPEHLELLTSPRLCEVCAQFGQAVGPDDSASNALRWEDFDDRMGYILTFFRAYQRDEGFFQVPAMFLGNPDGSALAQVAEPLGQWTP